MARTDDSVIELEPTLDMPAGGEALTAARVGGASLFSFPTSGTGLLRSRIFAAALFLAVAYGLLTVFAFFYRDSPVGSVLWSLLARTLLCASIAGLLASRARLSELALRGTELTLFLGLTLAVMVTQYIVDLDLIRADDPVRLVAVEKNGILNMVVLMIIYGVFIPNSPATTARVVLTMALGPLIVLCVLVERQVERAHLLGHIASEQMAVSNALFLLIGAGLAIYSAYVLHGLRGQLHEARKMGQYRLGEKLGEGGMGEVYLAEHQFLKRPCALKTIRADLNTNSIALARFEREVQAAAMLEHPNSIQIYDYGHDDDGSFYYVMEYLPGLGSGEIVRRFGPMPPGRAVYLMTQVSGALAEAHKRGLVHRDLKPGNIMVAILGGKYDVAKVLDFGLVKLTDDAAASQLTADYSVSGTPLFMSPEQATGTRDLDGRADLYALGAILYFWLTGRPPFDGDNAMNLMIAHARDAVDPPTRHVPGLPADLEAVVLKCLAKKPEDRFADARALADALAACACAADWGQPQAERWWTERAFAEARPNAEPKSADHPHAPVG